jgi:hypothetical protein
MSSTSLHSTGIAPTILEYCYQYVAWSQTFESFTIISKHTLCTNAHGRHWGIGDVKSVILSDNRVIQVVVYAVDETLDVIWLKSDEPLCAEDPRTGLPSEGRSYFMVGHSGRQLQKDPMALRDGIFCSTQITTRGHVLGSSGSSKGDSGAPLFWKSTGRLVGMNVGCEIINVESSQGNLYVGETPRSYIVPISSLLLRRFEHETL